MSQRTAIVDLLANQPNIGSIRCGRYRQPRTAQSPFTYLSRGQQIEQLQLMLDHGIDLVELERELYLVADKPTRQVWWDFGFPAVLEPPV